MNRAWMDALRTSGEYQKGVEEFIEFSKRNAPSKNGRYPCPCVKCVNVEFSRSVLLISDTILIF